MINFKLLRPTANYPTYPPYHTGDYLEEYFYKFYKNNKNDFDNTGFTLIPIFWTNIYNTGVNQNLIQFYLNALPTTGKYFTVSQHDDAVREKLPCNTLSFEAGGNGSGIPIPLICSPLLIDNSDLLKEKDIFCSFVGSINTHPLRGWLFNHYRDDNDILFSNQQWEPTIKSDRLKHFIDITSRSIFSLCPRGYGAQSFRLYEVLQLGTIPVVIYDKEWLPFSDILDWKSFAVLVHSSQIGDLKNILNSITNEKKQDMIIRGQEVYKKYFTLEQVSKQILNILQNVKK